MLGILLFPIKLQPCLLPPVKIYCLTAEYHFPEGLLHSIRMRTYESCKLLKHVCYSNFPFHSSQQSFSNPLLSIQTRWDMWQVKAFEIECNLTWKHGGALFKAGVCMHTSYTYNLLFAHVKRNAFPEFAACAAYLHVLNIQGTKL